MVQAGISSSPAAYNMYIYSTQIKEQLHWEQKYFY